MKKCRTSIHTVSHSNCMLKLLRIMKLTMILLLTATIQVFANSVYSQDTELTLNLGETYVGEVLTEIENQSEFYFLFNQKLVDTERQVSIQLSERKIVEVLDQLFSETNTEYIVMDRQIVLSPKEYLAEVKAALQPRTISGSLVDQFGEPLLGATVSIKGTTVGTITDVEGNYLLSDVPEDATLVFSFVGMLTQEVAIGNQTSINITMEADVFGLEEVVAVGYGVQRRSELTGSISSINRQEITEQPVYNFAQAIQGLAAGVRVETNSYRPGEGATIRVRGIRSFVASNDPLIVLDGIPIEGGLSDINTRNIASVEILKDASATAIYGSKGANGVILITTRHGIEGKTTIEYSGYTGIKTLSKKVEFMDASRYAEMKREAHKVQGTFTGNDEDMFEVFELNGLEQGISTDWQEHVWQTGFEQDHQLTLRGGDEKTRFLVTTGFQEDIAIAPNNDYTRFNGQSKLYKQVTSWLSVDVSSQIMRSTKHQAGDIGNTFDINPLAEPYDEDGNLVFYPAVDIFQQNPLYDYIRENYEDRAERTRFLTSIIASANITENLVYKLTFAADWRMNNDGRFRGSETVARQLGTADARLRNRETANYLLDNLIQYRKTFADKHLIDATFLYSLQSFRDDYRGVDVENLPYESQRFYNIGTAELVLDKSSNLEEWLLESTMARINYSFDDRYLLTLTGRLDGSTRFAEGNKYGFFPSAAIGWNISNEGFMLNQQLFDMLRLRLSYGTSGNTAIAPYLSLGGLSRVGYSFGNLPAFGFEPNSLANPDLRWESTSQANVGLEFVVLNNRVNANFNFYRADTKDLLMNRQLPPTSGFSSVNENVGSTRNTGIEISLSSENISTGKFVWTTGVNISANRNEITELYGGLEDDPGNSWFIGHPVDVHFDWQFDGIWQLDESDEAASYNQNPGEMRMVDVDNDGSYTADDRVILGSPYPDAEVGFTTQFTYANFDLSASIYGVFGTLISAGAYNSSQVPLRARYNSREVNFWTENNPSNEWPQPRFDRHFPEMRVKSYVSGDYVRIRNLTLAYRLPASLTQRAKMTSARVYISGQNLYTFTNFEGLDPEAATGNSFPNARKFLIGVNLTF